MTTSGRTHPPGTSDTDTELGARFLQQAAPLFDALARRARRLTHNDADAEDLLQDTLLQAYNGFHTYREGTNFAAWMYRIMQNRWISCHRTKQRRPTEIAVDAITDRHMLRTASHTTGEQSAEAQVLDTVPRTDLRDALAALPDGFTTVLYYADVQGYTYAETAAIMDIPIGTVMSRISRARQRLRASLGPLTAGPYSDATARIA